jgi:Icc-related predicted phosphoesterase
MKLVCLSDTHGDHRQVVVPAGDVLLHAGDLTAHGAQADFEDFLAWFSAHPHRHKLFIAGNHDLFLESSESIAQQLLAGTDVTWLNDSGVCIDGVNFWGSPITLRFHDWAFMREPGDDIAKHWQQIPANTDVLLTHGPPHHILDTVQRPDNTEEHTGCPQLRDTVLRVQPRVHLFGHIHEGHGALHCGGVDFLNVSTMDQAYRITHRPVEYELK